MPAERSRGSRRCGADANQLVWTMPVEPTSPTGISFATNVTPITFTDSDSGPPPLVPAPAFSSSFIFEQADSGVEPGSPKRTGHGRKKPSNHIPRPPNAFILFRSSFIKSSHVSTQVETNHSTLSKIIGLTWQNLPQDERQLWHEKAKVALDEHKRKFPTYAFKPLSNKDGKTKGEKRKVREVGVKDMKRCAKIAQLLVEGKKGKELDEAIVEFDRHHVPEIVTRFEAPITAKAFRRSSSAPAMEAPPKMTTKFLQERSPPSTPRKPRAQSTRPSRHTSPTSSPTALPHQSTESGLYGQGPFYSADSFGPFTTESSFDFNSFSFSNDAVPQMPTPFSCSVDPLAPAFSSHPDYSLPPVQQQYTQQPQQLSIDTSMFNWNLTATRSSSPMTASSGRHSPAAMSRCDSGSSSIFLDGLDDPYLAQDATAWSASSPASSLPSDSNPFIAATSDYCSDDAVLSAFYPVPSTDVDFASTANVFSASSVDGFCNMTPLDPRLSTLMNLSPYALST